MEEKRKKMDMKDYVHGGDCYGREIELDYSININPLGMPEESKRAAREAVLFQTDIRIHIAGI